MTELNKKIRDELFSLQDKKYQNFHSSLCPGTDNIIGVRTPLLRKLAKELSKEVNIDEYLKEASDDYYEEIMLQAMVIGCAKLDLDTRFEYMSEFIPKIYNWAVCDIFCASLKFTKKNQQKMFEFITKYLKSDKEFETRFAIVMLLDYYIDNEHINTVLKIIDSTKHEGFYVKMALAWAVSICFIKFPERTMKYLTKNTLDDFTYNKALQKITESLRVAKETKDIIRSMKR